MQCMTMDQGRVQRNISASPILNLSKLLQEALLCELDVF
jgi:hypothetical protein